jgi:hypothetical protein
MGIPTASQFHKILTPGGKPSAQARPYMYRLIAERLLQESMDDNLERIDWVQRGKVEEPNAAAQFQFTNNIELELVGFVTTEDGRFGCSPDRIVKGKQECVEIKCPLPFTQIGYLLDGPGDQYRAQVQGQLLVGDFELVHFYAWHPRMPPVHIKTVRDEPYIKILDQHLRDFADMLDAETDRAKRLGAYVAVNAAPGMEETDEIDYQGEEPLGIRIPGQFPWTGDEL